MSGPIVRVIVADGGIIGGPRLAGVADKLKQADGAGAVLVQPEERPHEVLGTAGSKGIEVLTLYPQGLGNLVQQLPLGHTVIRFVLNAEEHDEFRRKPGAWKRAMEGIDVCQRIGLPLYIQTVVTKQRLHSEEFIQFLEYFNRRGLNVFISFAKPVGAYAGRFESMVDEKDLAYERELEKKYRLCTHLTPGYGLDMGCIGVKGFISVTQYGDVQPCPYFHCSIGNVLSTPLRDILETGMGIKYFGEHVDTCLLAADLPWVKKYVADKIYGKPVPVPCAEVFTEEDRTRRPYWKE